MKFEWKVHMLKIFQKSWMISGFEYTKTWKTYQNKVAPLACFFCKTNIDKIKIARYKNEIRIVIKCKYTHCFPRNIYPVRSLLWFVGVGTNWFQPCPSGELHWYWRNPFRLFDPNLRWRPNWKTKQIYQNINLLVINVKWKWLDNSMRSFLLNKHN